MAKGTVWALVAGLAICGAAASTPAPAAELVMFEQPGCAWCQRWDKEIGVAYPHSWEGRAAPLRRVDITEPWPGDLAYVKRDSYTPTFVLIDGGRELSRLRGYPGDNFFWPLLDQMLAKLGHDAAAADRMQRNLGPVRDLVQPVLHD